MPIPTNEMGLAEITVDSKLYQFTKWGAEKSLDVLCDVFAVCGDAVSNAAGALTGDGANADTRKEALGQIIGALMKGLSRDKATTMSVLRRLTTGDVYCDHKAIAFDTHFAGDLMHLFRVVKAAFEVQYGDFFGAALSISGLQAAPTAKSS